MRKTFTLSKSILTLLAFCMFSINSKATIHTVLVGSPGNSFSPSSMTVYLGDTVRFQYVSGYHTTTSTTIPSGATPWNAQMISPSNIYNYVPSVIGSYSYYCVIHSSSMFGSFSVATPLPIKMDALKGKLVGGDHIELYWKTYSEQNNHHFEIQRSEDGMEYKTIAQVKSLAKEAANVSDISYSYEDEKPVNKRVFYRLKQVDVNGKSSYSNVYFFALMGKDDIIVKLHPNPATTSVMVHIQGDIKGTAELELRDITGKLVDRMNVTNHDEKMPVFDISKLSAGTYLIKYIDNNQTVSEKLTIE